MLTSKQRSKLRSIAQKIEPITQLGKTGITPNFLDGLDSALEKREIIKITVIENSGEDPKSIGAIIASELGAEFVCATSRKLVFYRRSMNDKVEHIEI